MAKVNRVPEAKAMEVENETAKEQAIVPTKAKHAAKAMKKKRKWSRNSLHAMAWREFRLWRKHWRSEAIAQLKELGDPPWSRKRTLDRLRRVRAEMKAME